MVAAICLSSVGGLSIAMVIPGMKSTSPLG